MFVFLDRIISLIGKINVNMMCDFIYYQEEETYPELLDMEQEEASLLLESWSNELHHQLFFEHK